MSDDDRIASGYDTFYEAWGKSPKLRTLWRDHVTGTDYPEEFAHISFVSLTDLRKLAESLALQAGDVLVDLACGAGGPGWWCAQQTGASLVGVDVSSTAVRRATERAAAVGLTERSAFRQGTFASTGLNESSADAVMTIDALQYAPDKRAALREMARILRPGGRLAMIAFELERSRVEGLGVWEDPVGDYQPLLDEAGFEVIAYEQLQNWRDLVAPAYTAVVAQQAELAEEMGDAAAGAIAMEAAITLQLDPYCGHAFAVAERRRAA